MHLYKHGYLARIAKGDGNVTCFCGPGGPVCLNGLFLSGIKRPATLSRREAEGPTPLETINEPTPKDRRDGEGGTEGGTEGGREGGWEGGREEGGGGRRGARPDAKRAATQLARARPAAERVYVRAAHARTRAPRREGRSRMRASARVHARAHTHTSQRPKIGRRWGGKMRRTTRCHDDSKFAVGTFKVCGFWPTKTLRLILQG